MPDEARSTQEIIEIADAEPISAEVRNTQNAIEYGEHGDIAVWVSQCCIEVICGSSVPVEEEITGRNNIMLLLDLGASAQTVPDYDPATIPDYD